MTALTLAAFTASQVGGFVLVAGAMGAAVWFVRRQMRKDGDRFPWED